MLRTIGLSAALAFASSTHALVVVDTGTPTESGSGLGVIAMIQELGAGFTLSNATQLDSVEFYLETSKSSTFVATVYSGADPNTAAVLTSTRAKLAAEGPATWLSFDFDDLPVGPGSYTVTVSALGNGDGYAPGDAPNPLDEWYHPYSNIWLPIQGSYGIGLRVNATPLPVPEPGTGALMLVGLVSAILGSRRRS